MPAEERLACRQSAGAADRRIRAEIAPQVFYCRAERAWPVGPIALPALETMEWPLGLPDRRDLWRRVLPEDLAGSQSLSSRPREVAKAQGSPRRLLLPRLPLPPPLQHPAIRLAMVWSERCQVSLSELRPAPIGLPERRLEVRAPVPA